MKKLLFIIPLLFIFTIQMNSQPRGKNRRPNFEKLKTDLNLTDEQAEKFEILLNQKIEEMAGLRELFKENSSEAREKMIEINDKYHKLFAEILDDEQLAKFEEITKERREKRLNRPEKNSQ